MLLSVHSENNTIRLEDWNDFGRLTLSINTLLVQILTYDNYGLVPVVQSLISAEPGLTHTKTYTVNPGLALIKL